MDDLAFEMEEAVGLLSRSADAELAAFFTGGGEVADPPFARAKEDAVGAYRPDDGVLGRMDMGVFARAGVFGAGGADFDTGGFFAGVLCDDWPVCCALIAGVADAARLPWLAEADDLTPGFLGVSAAFPLVDLLVVPPGFGTGALAATLGAGGSLWRGSSGLGDGGAVDASELTDVLAARLSFEAIGRRNEDGGGEEARLARLAGGDEAGVFGGHSRFSFP